MSCTNTLTLACFALGHSCHGKCQDSGSHPGWRANQRYVLGTSHSDRDAERGISIFLQFPTTWVSFLFYIHMLMEELELWPFSSLFFGSLDLELIFSVAWVEGHDGSGWFFFRWWVGLLYRYQVPTTFFQSCQAFIPSCRPANGAPSNSCMPKGTIHTIPWEEGKQRDPTDDNSLSAPIIIIIIIPSQDYCNEGITWTAMEECHSCLFGVTTRKIQLLFSTCFSVFMPEICLLHKQHMVCPCLLY